MRSTLYIRAIVGVCKFQPVFVKHGWANRIPEDMSRMSATVFSPNARTSFSFVVRQSRSHNYSCVVFFYEPWLALTRLEDDSCGRKSCRCGDSIFETGVCMTPCQSWDKELKNHNNPDTSTGGIQCMHAIGTRRLLGNCWSVRTNQASLSPGAKMFPGFPSCYTKRYLHSVFLKLLTSQKTDLVKKKS